MTTLHIVDENLILSDSTTDHLKKWGFYNKGMDYFLVAIFGSQSSGKSTLLNLLFDTPFEVMNEKSRQQTTKGLWMSPSTIQNVLVMDVEGTDGRERGEDQQMERKSALFSLAIAPIMIINMFEHDVGRFNGANYGLLKTVFEVNLQLFLQKDSPKTLLIFVIRDQGMTPLENLSRTLSEDMQKIWSEIPKPSKLESSKSQFLDFFDVKFVGLPHKVYRPEEFTQKVAEFREWFVNKENPNFALKQEYHKLIPADGFPKFTIDIWDKILNNRDLDLPTQRQLLAQYRCDEIAKEAYEHVAAFTKSHISEIEKGHMIETLGPNMLACRDKALESYVLQGNRYDEIIFEAVRKDLIEKINSSLFSLYSGQLRNLVKASSAIFSDNLNKLLSDRRTFAEACREASRNSVEYFNKHAIEMTLTETDWDFSARLEEIKGIINDETRLRKKKEIERIFENSKKFVKSNLVEPISLLLGKSEENMWAEIDNAIKQVFKNSVSVVEKENLGLDLSETELEEMNTNIITNINQLFIELLTNETSDTVMNSKLKKRFEKSFKYDEQQRPRIWKPTDDINFFFDKAKAESQKLLNLFEICQINNDIVNLESNSLISPRKKGDMWERFELEANALYQEAQRSTTQSVANIPPWFFILLVVLGWNEIWMVLTNPLYLILVVLIGVGAYVIYTLNLQQPVYQMTKTISMELAKVGKDVLVEKLKTNEKKD